MHITGLIAQNMTCVHVHWKGLLYYKTISSKCFVLTSTLVILMSHDFADAAGATSLLTLTD